MATETTTAQPAASPELTIISRVASIPIVASSLDTIHSTLSSNTYTRTTYAYTQELSKTALSYTEPLQKRFAPILVRADGFANKGLDVVESRCPYPFKTPTEDIYKDLKDKSDYAYNVANKTIDERVKSPAYTVVQGIDQRFAPVVNYFESKVHPSAESPPSTEPSDSPPYQYQRAYALSKELGDQLYTYSAEQINQIRAQNVLVQRASEATARVSAVASSSYGAAQEKVHVLSDVMLQELQKVQASTATLPAAVQSSFNDITTHLSGTINELSAILSSSAPLPEKAHKVRDTVQESVQPILEASAIRVQALLDALRGKAAEKTEAVKETANGNGVANGSANGNGIVNGNHD